MSIYLLASILAYLLADMLADMSIYLLVSI